MKRRLKRLCLAFSVCFVFFLGCRSNRPEVRPTYSYDDLYKCIELIERGEIKRGMNSSDLARIWGDAITFRHAAKDAIVFLSGPPQNGWPAQPAPLWSIQFELNDDGIVSDYCIALGEEK